MTAVAAPSTKDAARRYQANGWPPVPIPAQAKGSPPEGLTGRGGRDLTADQVEQLAWTGNVTVRMPVGVLGLDVDCYAGKPGAATLADLAQQLGPLPATWRLHNGRGDGSGIRLYRVPEWGHWRSNLPGVDVIQRTHRYAMAAPSIHPEGRRYAITDPAGVDVDTLPPVDELPELPWPWVEYLTSTSGGDGEPVVMASPDDVDTFRADHTRADKPHHATVIADTFRAKVARGESRHDSMTHAVVWAAESAAAGVIAAASTFDELRALWGDTMRDEPRRRHGPEFALMVRHAVGRANGKTDEQLAGIYLAATGDPCGYRYHQPPTADGEQLDDGDQGDQPEGGGDLDDGMVPLIDWTEIHDPADDIVEGLIMRGRWTQAVAGAKVGKSTLLLWIALELAEGRDPFDGTPIPPVVVLWVDGEMGRADLRDLIADCGRDPATVAQFHAIDATLRLDTDTGAARLLRRVEQLGARLVILDGLNGFVDPEASENSDTVWRALMDRTVRPLKRLGVAVVSADNYGKDTTRGARGSSVKADKADGVVAVARTDTGVRLTVTHGRGGAYLTTPVALDAVGLDRSEPIQYRRALGGVPAGTAAAVKVLDALGVPCDLGRPKVRALLREAATEAEAKGQDPARYRVDNNVLGPAIRSRRERMFRRAGGTP